MKLDKVVVPKEPRYTNSENWGDFIRRRERYNQQYARLRGNLNVSPSSNGLSCAFPSVRGQWGTTEDVVWNQFCWVMGELKRMKKPCLIPITDREHLARDLFMACPWVTHHVSAKSRHGDYTAHIFTVEVN